MKAEIKQSPVKMEIQAIRKMGIRKIQRKKKIPEARAEFCRMEIDTGCRVFYGIFVVFAPRHRQYCT